MNEVDGLYNCGSITGQSNSPGYPWEHEGRGFCESVSRLVEGASEEEVQKIREIAEVVFLVQVATVKRFAHRLDFLVFPTLAQSLA